VSGISGVAKQRYLYCYLLCSCFLFVDRSSHLKGKCNCTLDSIGVRRYSSNPNSRGCQVLSPWPNYRPPSSNTITPSGRVSRTDTPAAPAQADRGSWPLPSIGNMKNVVECQTQGSSLTAVSHSTERAKRPHDDDALDPANRMRFTPQLQATAGSIISENKITRIETLWPARSQKTLPYSGLTWLV
jgi:hypothetical protein